MAQFRIDPDGARAQMGPMSNENDAMLQSFTSLKKIVDDLDQVWEGDAQQEFSATFTQIGAKVTELHNLVEEAKVSLGKAAELYEKTNAEIAKAMQLQ